MEANLRLGFFLGILIILAIWESFKPKRKLSQPKSIRWVVNLGLLVVNTLLYRGIFGLTLFAIGLYAENQAWGLFYWLEVPRWLNFVAGIFILDFAVYLQHVLFHIIPFLWPLHRVHHTDLDFDVTTGLRFHPIEIIISMFFKGGVVLLFGIAPWSALIFEILLNGFSQFTHTNVVLRKGFESRFRWVFVTPDMHRIHHSTKPKEFNRNFGFSFSFWDRMFRTYRKKPSEPHETMAIGQSAYPDGKKLGFFRLLIQPFR